MIRSPFTRQHHLSNVLQKTLQQYLKWQQNRFSLPAGPGLPHSQECGPTPDHCQEAQLEGLGPQQEAGLEGMARQQKAHQCVPLLTSGLPHCSSFQQKAKVCEHACAFCHLKMVLPCVLLLDG